MSAYTYLACDLRTDQVLDELPLTGVTFGRGLGADVRQLRAKVPLGDRKWPASRLWAATQPARTMVWVARDDQLVGGYILWTRNRRTGEVSGSEVLSYFTRRHVRTTMVAAGVDQLSIARNLLAAAQTTEAGAVGDLGVQLGPASTSGVLRDRTYDAADRKSYADALTELANVQGGFELRIDAVGSIDNRAKMLVLGYPRLGRAGASSGLQFELPGNLSDYDWPEDGTELSTLADALGAGDEGRQLVGTATQAALEAAGYPRLERTGSYSDVTDQATLDGHAAADLAASAGLVIYPKLVVRAGAAPQLGTYDPGDDARVRITDTSWPRPAAGGAGLDTTLRLLGIDCTPAAGGADEKVQLTMGGVLSL